MTNSVNKVQTTSLNRTDMETIIQLMIVDICSLLAHRRSLLQSIEAMKQYFGFSMVSDLPKLNFEYEKLEMTGNNGFSDISDYFAAIKLQYEEKMVLKGGSKRRQQKTTTTGCDSVPPISCFSKEAPVDINSCGSYEFSPELQFVARNRALQSAGLDVVNLKLAHKSAIIIQRAYRNHRVKKYFEKCFIHRRKQSLQSASSKPINFDQQLSLTKIPPPVPIRKHSGNRISGCSERTPDWTQTFAADCNKDGLAPLLSESFTPPRSGAVLFSRRSQALTPADEMKKSYPSNVSVSSVAPAGGFSNTSFFCPSSVSAVQQGSHFPFPVNNAVCNNANRCAANLVRIEPSVCNRSSSNSEHASTGSDEGIESAPTSANSNYDNYNNQEDYSSSPPVPPQMPPLTVTTSVSEAAPLCSSTTAVANPYSMLSSTAVTSQTTSHSNNSSLSSSSMLSNPPLLHDYTGTTTQSTNCLSLSLPVPPHSEYENSRSLGGGSCGGLSPRTPPVHSIHHQQGAAKHFASQPSVLQQKPSPNTQKCYHFSAVPKSTSTTSSKMQTYLNENLVQLYNCRRTGVRYSPQQEMTIRIGMFLFNKDPKKGLKFLTEKQFLEPDSPGDVAYMLTCYKRGLNKARIGEYLASEKPFNCSVLRHFVELHRPRLENKAIDEALRVFMSMFRLPGESQKIDRILMRFGHVYASVNKPVALMLSGAWADANVSVEKKLDRGASAAHILSYAIMMLNTDLHNSNVRGNMSMKDFKRNCRGSDELKHLDDNFLEGIYKRIKANQFREPEDHSTAIALFSSNLHNFNKNMLLDEPFRCLVAVCPFHVALDAKNTKNIQEVYLFLFNDMLLAATREQGKKKLSKSSQLPVDLATVFLQTFTYRFDIPLLHLNVEAFELTANNDQLSNSFSWCLRVSQNALLSCSPNGGSGPLVYDFFCSNYDDFLKFNNDLKIYVKDMSIIDQLRIQDNLQYMYNPLDEHDRRQKELNGCCYEGRGSDCSVSNGGSGAFNSDLRSSRNKSNSVDSLLDPVGANNNNNDGGINTAALQRMLNSRF